MKRAFVLAGTAALALGLSGSARAQTELTFSTWVPLNHPISIYIFNPWFEKVEKESGGKVKFKTLPKPIAAPNQHYDAVVKGQVDLAYSTLGYQPERFFPYLIAELPQLGETAVHNGVALWRTHQKYFDKLGMFKDVVLIGLMTHGPGLMHHTKKPIMNPEDLKGQKIRVGGDVPKLIVEHFGGVVITQPAPKSYEILSQGIADGIFFPMESVKSFNIAKIVTHTTYVKGGRPFWQSVFISGTPTASAEALEKALMPKVVDQWVELPEASTATIFHDVLGLTAAKSWVQGSLSGMKGTLSNNGTQTLSGKTGVEVTSSTGAKVVIAASGPARPLAFTAHVDDKGSNFSLDIVTTYPASVTIAAPSSFQVLSQLESAYANGGG